MFSKSSRHQLLATLCVNVITVCFGVAIGWPSASLLVLESDDTPLPSGPLTKEHSSWIGSLIAMGGLSGNILFGWLSGRVGRKFILLAVFVPQFCGWLLVYVAQNMWYLYAARFLLGFSGGGIYVVMPVFVAEIADSRIRGTLGAMFMLFCNFGILLAFVLGHFCSYLSIPLMLMGACACYLVGVIFLPDTPQYLLRTGQDEEAEKSLRFYRNVRIDAKEQMGLLQTEMDILRNANTTNNQNVSEVPRTNGTAKDDTDDDVITWRDFCTPHARKALGISVFLMWLKTFAGLYVMVTYAGTIFSQSGLTISANVASIVIGAVQLAGTYVAILLVDRGGRRILLGFSTIGTGISLTVLATFLLLRQRNPPLVEGYGWVAVTSFSAVLFLGSCGIVPMPFVVTSEVMPPKIRSYGSSIGTVTLFGFAFVLMKFFATLYTEMGMHGCFYMFAVCSFVGTLFVAVCMPETRGKSFEEIGRVMAGRKK